MPRAGRTNQRQNTRNPPINTHTGSIDLFSDAIFLLSDITCDDIFLLTLISGQITNVSFSELYERSKIIGWKQVLIELRNDVRSDEKSKQKQFIINRLIEEYSTNTDIFDGKVKELYAEINRQMSDLLYNYFPSIDEVYAYVNAWRELQCQRRLSWKGCNLLYTLLTLQRVLTDYFIELVDLLKSNLDWFFQSDVLARLKQLFNHCLIVVAQPSSTDCRTVTKYEKPGQEYVVKIRTRIISLLDPDRVKEHLKISNADLTVYLKDRTLDPSGEVQSSLPWKTRTVICNENERRTFSYIELNENDSIKLVKKKGKKLLYNNHLCQLEFKIKFEISETNFRETVTLNSELFGLCSHTKYTPELQAKVFLEKLNQTHTEIQVDTHINTLVGYIDDLYKCMSGVETKPHTKQFMHEELTQVYMESYQSSASSGSEFTVTWNIYEKILQRFIRQMKFLANHLFLSMMYHDSLFLGICNSSVDQLLINSTSVTPQILMRFATLEEQINGHPNIIFASYNGILSKSRILHTYFITDMITCICETTKINENQLQVFNYDRHIPFYNFSRYYDADLCHDNSIQTSNEIKYLPLKTLLRDTIQNNQIQPEILNGQQAVQNVIYLSLQFLGNTDLRPNAIAFLQNALNQWCGIQNVPGLLSEIPSNIDLDELI